MNKEKKQAYIEAFSVAAEKAEGRIKKIKDNKEIVQHETISRSIDKRKWQVLLQIVKQFGTWKMLSGLLLSGVVALFSINTFNPLQAIAKSNANLLFAYAILMTFGFGISMYVFWMQKTKKRMMDMNDPFFDSRIFQQEHPDWYETFGYSVSGKNFSFVEMKKFLEEKTTNDEFLQAMKDFKKKEKEFQKKIAELEGTKEVLFKDMKESHEKHIQQHQTYISFLTQMKDLYQKAAKEGLQHKYVGDIGMYKLYKIRKDTVIPLERKSRRMKIRKVEDVSYQNILDPYSLELYHVEENKIVFVLDHDETIVIEIGVSKDHVLVDKENPYHGLAARQMREFLVLCFSV